MGGDPRAYPTFGSRTLSSSMFDEECVVDQISFDGGQALRNYVDDPAVVGDGIATAICGGSVPTGSGSARFQSGVAIDGPGRRQPTRRRQSPDVLRAGVCGT